jgi:fumarate hydratase class II
MAASQGNFELNVFMPVLIDNFLRSVRLLSCGLRAFCERCVIGIRPNRERMRENLHRSLMLATALNPHIGYENAAKTVHLAHEKNMTLREACITLGFLDGEAFDRVFKPEEMTNEKPFE